MSDHDYSESKRYRCLIKQHQFTSAEDIADKFNFKDCQETFHFKRRAVIGALQLEHTELAAQIKDQMNMIAEAQALIIQKGQTINGN